MQGKVELAEALDTTGPYEEGENWRERIVGKAAGDERVFILGRGSGWQMRQAQTPYRTRRGGEGGQGVAKLDFVIHRYP